MLDVGKVAPTFRSASPGGSPALPLCHYLGSHPDGDGSGGGLRDRCNAALANPTDKGIFKKSPSMRGRSPPLAESEAVVQPGCICAINHSALCRYG